MSVFRNRHVVVAALVAPVLALIAYFAIDFFFGETPHAAVEGQSYPLAETPGCRWASGACGLKNNEFELTLSFRTVGGETLLLLESAHALDGVMLSVARDEAELAPPRPMAPAADDGRRWTLDVVVPEPGRDRLRLAASAGGTLYFGDASTAFVQSTGENEPPSD
jgi:hypothetical protein